MSICWDELPKSIQDYQAQIKATLKPSIEMVLKPAKNLKVWQSKIGGDPYLPVGQQYPKSAEGENLQLLAQINFAELPQNDEYPEAGILQFFINPQDDLYGLDFEDQQKQDGFKIIFHDVVQQDLSQLQQQFPEIVSGDFMSPISGQSAIQFERKDCYIDMNDFEFSQKVLDLYALDDDVSDAFCDEYSESFSGSGHRLGGYPFFTQTDPREYNEKIKDYVLLLQIDTDDVDGNEIMWGDSGVGNFFIHPDDLKKRDFSKVLYNWDCC